MYAVRWFLPTRLALLLALGLLAWATPLYAAAPAAVHATEVGGNITTDTTWTLANSPYEVTNNIFIQNGATLTIQPGVQVIATAANIPVTPAYRINVDDGALIAQGTISQPITFTASAPTKGAWYGIAAGNSALSPSILTLRHVTVEYGGGPIFPDATDFGLFNGGNVEVDGPAQVTIEDSILRNSSSNGINAELDAEITISNTAINNNILTAVRFESNVLFDPHLSGLSGSGNGLDAVSYNNTHITPETGDFTLELSGLTTRLEGGFFVEEGGHAILAPGVEAQIQNGFYVDGRLTAVGTEVQPVIFTGINKTPGGWSGLDLNGGELPTQALFDHVVIEYGGEVDNDFTANLLVGSSVVTVTNSIIRNGGSSGIHNEGGAPGETMSLLVENTQILNNNGRAFLCDDESCHQQLSGLTISGNGANAFVQRGSMTGEHLWNKLGVPYLVEEDSGINPDSKLVIEPGVEVQFAQDTRFGVNGILIAVGTPTEPITFTASQQQTGWWQGIYVSGPQSADHPESGIADLRYCDISYGGTTGIGMLQLASNTAFVVNCRIHHSASSGIETITNVMPVISHNRFESNPTYGLLNNNGTAHPLTVDARDNWWGATSGPQHATNPTGTGNAVSDRVLFDPWLTSPDDAGQGGLQLRVAGVARYSPGETIQYGIFYSNLSNETITDAVLRVALPGNSQYEDSTGGIYWPERRHVFWKLGTLAPGQSGSLALRVTYDWGLPDGIRTTIAAQLSAANVADSPFTLTDYLNYVERQVESETELSEADLTAARGSLPDLQIIYNQAIADGFVFGSARRQNFNTGDVLNEAMMIKFQPRLTVFYLWWQGGDTSATGARVDGNSFTVYKPGRGLRYDLQTNQWAEVDATALVAADEYTWSDCMKNCIEEKLPGYIVKKHIKVLSNAGKAASCFAAASGDAESIVKCSKIIGKSIPGYGEAVDLGLCNSDCQNCEESGGSSDNEKCHYCTEDKYRCSDDDWLYGTFDIDVVKVRRCPDTGKYLAEEVIRVCALCEKCIDGGDGAPACVSKNVFANVLSLAAPGLQAATVDLALVSAPIVNECETCLLAKDPNEMHGPEGDLLPGQTVTYTIDYENVGAGSAFGVFIANQLSDAFDLSTLQLSGDAFLSVSSRTIYFQIGELAPKDQAGSKGQVSYTIKLRSDLPSGTVISNQAIVYFPSVPEETPTNSVVNVIQPIIVQPQLLQTPYQQALAITLHGQDAVNTTLSFSVVDQPLYGTLTGTPPNLSYQPAPGFVGLDRFTFVASNGSSTSREAEVRIEVQADPNDKSAPTVIWSAPNQGEQVDAAMALATGGEPLYTPRLQFQFSEAINAATVTSATIQLTLNGQPVPINVQFDRTIDQAVALLRVVPQPNSTYVATVTTGVKDLAGNALKTPFALTFTTGDFLAPEQGSVIFLPKIDQ